MMRKIRAVISLCSAPATPVSVVTVLLGYISYEPAIMLPYTTFPHTILTDRVVPLVAAAALGHWGFYAANDVFDYDWDKRQGRNNKPLVRGDISWGTGILISVLLASSSLLVAILYFPQTALYFWVMAIIAALAYNVWSKERSYSGIYLSAWGASVIFAGAYYGGEATYSTILIALLLAVHMFYLVIIGDLKDIGQGEESIPEMLDCKVVGEGGYDILWTSGRFNVLALLLVLVQIILILLIPVSDGAHAGDVWFVYVGVIGAVLVWETFANVIYQPGFDTDKMSKDITKHEIVNVVFLLVMIMSFAEWESIVVLAVGSVSWGIILQTILYGHPLRFP